MIKTKSSINDEILMAERNSFVVRIGNEFYNKDGEFIFTQSQAEKHYNILLYNIIKTIESGSERQKIAAEKCFVTLQVLPLRIH